MARTSRAGAKKASAKKAAEKRSAAKRTAAKKTAVKRPAAKKAVAKKTAAKKAGAKKAVAKKAVAKKTVAKKTAAKKTAAKKTAAKRASPKKAAERTVAPAKGSGLDPSRAWSLDELLAHLPKVDPAEVARVRESMRRALGDEGLLGLGTSFTTEDILAAAPSFTVGALLALRSRKSPIAGLSPALLPLLVQETRELARVNAAFEEQLRRVSSAISGRRAKLRRANSKALAARRTVVRVLLNAVLPHDSPVRAVLERAAGKAPTAAATVASVRTVAEELAKLRSDEAYTPLLDSYGYGDAHVTYLRGLADEVERLDSLGARLTPPQLTDQRALDLQDGLVLAIIRAIWLPLRDARAAGESLALPPLGPLERMFVRSEPAGDDEALTEEDGAEAPAGPA